MSSENVIALQRAFAAFAKGDMETLAESIDPSFELEDRILPEASPIQRGPQALVVNAERVKEAFGEVHWEPREVVDLDDLILVRVHVSGSGRHTDLPIDDDIGHVYTLKDGKAVRLDIFRTWEEAKAHAGLEGA